MTIKIKTFQGKYFAVNSYLIIDDENNAFIIDPSSEKLDNFLRNNNDIKLSFILITHAHFDHITHLDYFSEKYNVPFYIHIDENEKLNSSLYNLSSQFTEKAFIVKSKPKFLHGNKGNFNIGKFQINYIKIPGHSKGMVMYILRNIEWYFTADLVFNNSIGRFDLIGSSYKDQVNSLKEFSKLDDNIKIYPGHGKSFFKKDLINNYHYMKVINNEK